jgi:hypothetical protein
MLNESTSNNNDVTFCASNGGGNIQYVIKQPHLHQRLNSNQKDTKTCASEIYVKELSEDVLTRSLATKSISANRKSIKFSVVLKILSERLIDHKGAFVDWLCNMVDIFFYIWIFFTNFYLFVFIHILVVFIVIAVSINTECDYKNISEHPLHAFCDRNKVCHPFLMFSALMNLVEIMIYYDAEENRAYYQSIRKRILT